MSVLVSPAELKKAVRIASQVKNVQESKSRASFWNHRHRLVASDNKLRLLTNDATPIWNGS